MTPTKEKFQVRVLDTENSDHKKNGTYDAGYSPVSMMPGTHL